MKILFAIIPMVFFNFSSAHAASSVQHPITLGEPAALVISAENAKVKKTEGKTTITLNNLNPLVTMIAALHKQRVFENFPVSTFAEHWNNCEKMKHSYHVGREDGYNANFSYGKGENNASMASYYESAPLLTNKNSLTRINKEEAGGLKLFVQNATYNSKNNSLSFEELRPALQAGDYNEIIMITECILTSQ